MGGGKGRGRLEDEFSEDEPEDDGCQEIDYGWHGGGLWGHGGGLADQ